jgi:hypothetical protein
MPQGKMIIDIWNMNHVFLYQLSNIPAYSDTIDAAMGFFNDSTIRITAPTTRFDYRLRGRYLIGIRYNGRARNICQGAEAEIERNQSLF